MKNPSQDEIEQWWEKEKRHYFEQGMKDAEKCIFEPEYPGDSGQPQDEFFQVYCDGYLFYKKQ